MKQEFILAKDGSKDLEKEVASLKSKTKNIEKDYDVTLYTDNASFLGSYCSYRIYKKGFAAL
jgi:hypothetical protein